MTMASAPGVPTPTVPLVLDEQMLTKEEIYYQFSRLMNAEQRAMTLHHTVSDTGLHSFRVIGTLTFNPFQCDFILDLTHNIRRFNVDIDLQTILLRLKETFYTFCSLAYYYPLPFESHISHSFYYMLSYLLYKKPVPIYPDTQPSQQDGRKSVKTSRSPMATTSQQ